MNTNYQIRIVVNTGRPYPVILWDDFTSEWPMGISYEGVVENDEITSKIDEIASGVISQKQAATTPDERIAAGKAKNTAETNFFKLMQSLRVAK